MNLALLAQFRALTRFISIDLGLVIYLNLRNGPSVLPFLRVFSNSTACIFSLSPFIFHSLDLHLFNAHTRFIARFSFMFCSRHICRIVLFIVYSIFLSIKFYEWNCAARARLVRQACKLIKSFLLLFCDH